MSLALVTLLYEWRRYSAAMVALAVAGLLILAQVGMFTGIVKGEVVRYDLDNLHSLEFVMRNALGGGATRTLMMDQTGKAYGPNLLRLVLDVED